VRANRLRSGIDRQEGQALVVSVVFMAALLGMAALAIDAGSWYRALRHEQAVVDAAALAGAQALPEDPNGAVTLAVSYAQKNGVTLTSNEVTISTYAVANDTIKVADSQSAPTFFAKIFGLASVNVSAHAAARSSAPSEARYVAPIVVPISNPMLQCSPPPCAGQTQINLLNLHQSGSGNASGAFALLNLAPGSTGTSDAGQLADWMLNGDQDEMPLGTYYGASSTNYNSSAFQDALSTRVGTEVLFPVYQPPILNGGSNGEFNIIDWVGFHITSQTANGSSGTLNGYFTRYIAQGLPAGASGPNGGAFGVHLITLVE
jgi:Flp pilus assembly protein TadG